MARIHISGGASPFHNVSRGDVAAMLETLGLAHQPPRNDVSRFAPALQGRRVIVGVDMTQLPNSEGSPPKVEWLPLTATAGHDILAGATRDYELKPTKYARPGALVIADTIAANLVMTNLQIGGKPVFAGSGAVPCILFSHLSVQNALSSYVASNNAPITFTLQNVHATVTQTVRGVWICDTSELAVG